MLARSGTAVKLGWAEPASIGCPITSYTVQADDGSGGALADLSTGAKILTPTEFELEISGTTMHAMTLGSRYRFRIIATNAVGTVESNIVDAIVASLPAAPSGSPVLVLEGTDVSVIRVSLAALDHTDDAETGGTTIVSYHLQRTKALRDIQTEQIDEEFFDVAGSSAN